MRLTAVKITGLIVALMLAGCVVALAVLVVTATSPGPHPSQTVHATLQPEHAPLAPRRGIIRRPVPTHGPVIKPNGPVVGLPPCGCPG